jgi:uncharacterized protein (DUF427 family)
MDQRQIKVPDASHPITIAPSNRRMVVTVAGTVIADTKNALVLQEAAYAPVLYLPRADVRMDLLVATDHTTYCPYKGDCSYYSIPNGGERSVNAVWSYEAPFPAMAQIKDYLAFYADRVDSIVEQPAADALNA